MSPAFRPFVLWLGAYLFLALTVFHRCYIHATRPTARFFHLGPANNPLLLFLISIDSRVSFNEDYVTAPQTPRHMNLFFVFVHLLPKGLIVVFEDYGPLYVVCGV